MPFPWAAKAAEKLKAAGGSADVGGDGIALLAQPPPVRAVVKSPGIPFTAPLLVRARELSLPVIDEAELGWRLDARPVVGITGTNGKSTTASLACAVLRAAGRVPLLAGNTELGLPLSKLPAHVGDVVVAELSSFQLEGCTHLVPEVGIFTNLATDHLDRHGDLAAYEAAKRRMFIRRDAAVPLAVVNVDDAVGRRLHRDLEGSGARVVTYGMDAGADHRLEHQEWDLRGSSVTLDAGGRRLELVTSLPGAHNGLNTAAAVALADALGIGLDLAGAAIEAAPPVPGRLQHLDGPWPLDVVVDFAHNPDGTRRALETLRAVVESRPSARLLVVASTWYFVAPEQMREHGRVLRTLSDHLVLTSERWIPSAPSDPFEAFVEGAHAAAGGRCDVVGDRRNAIWRALNAAEPGDVVAILGRGARRGTLFGADDEPRAFDDRIEARVLLEHLYGTPA